ncbi:hypothetical protein ACOME3_006684 [Neoechinorhynchus agilis]
MGDNSDQLSENIKKIAFLENCQIVSHEDCHESLQTIDGRLSHPRTRNQSMLNFNVFATCCCGGGCIWPPNTHDLSSTERTKTLSSDQDDPKYIDRPTKRWLHTVILTSNPIWSREIMHQRLITPWLRTIKDDRERSPAKSKFISSVTSMKNSSWISLTNTAIKVFTFLVSGLSPHIDSEDR